MSESTGHPILLGWRKRHPHGPSREQSARIVQSTAKLGIIHSYAQTPKQMLEEFYKRDPSRDIDKIFAGLVSGAPAVKQAEAKLQSAAIEAAWRAYHDNPKMTLAQVQSLILEIVGG